MPRWQGEPGAAYVEFFTDLLSNVPMASAARLGNGDTHLINVDLPYQMRGRQVSEMNVPGEVNVVIITRKVRTFLPAPTT